MSAHSPSFPQPKFGPDGEYLGVQWQDKRVGLKEMEFIRKWEESQTPEERRLEREWQRQQNGPSPAQTSDLRLDANM